MEYFTELLNMLNAMSPYLLLGFFIAGLLHIYLPKAAFSKHLSKPNFKSVFLSALFGIPLPLCSCGVIPTAMSLKREGASNGATVSFLIATPQTGVDSILASYGALGLPFAIIRPIVAFVVALAGGAFVNRFSADSVVNVGQKIVVHNHTSHGKGAKFVDALKYGFVDMLQDLGKWLTIGLIVAAAITAFVPESIFELLNEYYLLNILVVLTLSIPMYICSTGSIPIALSLLLLGCSPGAVLIFLMAGPATNVATLAVVRKVLGTRTTVLYLLSIILGAIGFALFIDFALPSEWFTSKLATMSGSSHCDCGVVWWQLGSSILFVVLLINAYALRFFKGMTHSHGVVEIPTKQQFKVLGMRCNHCKANVERAIATMEGVESVQIDLESGIVEVDGNVSRDEVYGVVRQLGFDIDLI